MLCYEVNGTLGKRIPFTAPEIPSDVAINIFSFKSSTDLLVPKLKKVEVLERIV
jgi:hypothetical protein